MVIVIISLLATALVSGIGTMRAHGHAAQCKTNLRNLSQGVINNAAIDSWTLYAQSFAMWHSADRAWYERRGWISWLNSSGNRDDFGNKFGKEDPPTGLYHATCYAGKAHADGRQSIRLGTLWELTGKDMKIYLCPTHRRTKVNSFPVCRSYAMNGYFYYSEHDQGNTYDDNGWGAWDPRKIYDIPEPMRMMLFAEIVPDAGAKGDGVLVAWDKANIPKGRYMGKNVSIDDVYDRSGLQSTPNESVGFNHRKQGQNYGFVAFLDGHVLEIPEVIDYGKTNATLRAALGRF